MNTAAIIAVGAAILEWRYGFFSEAMHRVAGRASSEARISRIEAAIDAPAQDIWMQRLLRHRHALSNWSAANLDATAAVMEQEIGHMPVTSISSAGAVGVMQVLPGTADWMSGLGYRQYEPTETTLKTEVGSIYFGTAYLEHLADYDRGLDWIWAAYYGGPGWQTQSARWVRESEAYSRVC